MEPICFNSSDEAVAFALANSRNLEFQKILSLEGLKRERWNIRSFLPAISVGYSQNDNIPMQSPDSRSKSFNISANQLIFDGGKMGLEHELAKINGMFTYQNYEMDKQNFILKIEEMFRQLSLYTKILEIKSDVYENSLKRLKILEKQLDLGRITQNDFYDYEVSVLELSMDLLKFQRNFSQSCRDFKSFIGLDMEREIKILDNQAENPLSCKKIGENFSDLYKIYENFDLDLKSQRINLEYQKKLQKLNQIQGIPNVNLQCSIAFSGKNFPLTEPSFSLKLGLNMNNDLFPVNYSPSISFNTDRIEGTDENFNVTILPSTTFVFDRRIGKIQLEKQIFEFSNYEKQVKENFRQLLFSHDDLLDDWELQRKIQEGLEKKLVIERIRTDNGEIKELDFLDSEIEFSNCKIKVEELKNQILLARKSLKIKLGGYEI